jgi:hypothetical protein
MSTSGANFTSGAKLRPEADGLPVQPASRDMAKVADRPHASTRDVSTRRSFPQVLKSYFYWTYSRGSFHYDVMVTLILAFIFITPWLWNYGDKPRSTAAITQPFVIMGDGGRGLIVTLQASDVNVPAGSSDLAIKKALKKAMEPVLGDSLYVERWQVTRDANGNPASWKVWAHK